MLDTTGPSGPSAPSGHQPAVPILDFTRQFSVAMQDYQREIVIVPTHIFFTSTGYFLGYS